jgi:hypothetical protein
MYSLLDIFNIDILNFTIINYIETFKDFKNIRLVNKKIYKCCMDFWKNYKGSKNISDPRSTMINISTCHICKKHIKNKSNLQINVSYYNYPQPIYVICRSWKCVHDCINHHFLNAWKNNRLYLNKNNYLPNKSIIPRSNNQITNANLDYDYIIFFNNKLLVNTKWYEKNREYTKSVEIKHLYHKKPFISSWYKNYNEIKLKDINDKIYDYVKNN